MAPRAKTDAERAHALLSRLPRAPDGRAGGRSRPKQGCGRHEPAIPEGVGGCQTRSEGAGGASERAATRSPQACRRPAPAARLLELGEPRLQRVDHRDRTGILAVERGEVDRHQIAEQDE